jgi:hypothetical protein
MRRCTTDLSRAINRSPHARSSTTNARQRSGTSVHPTKLRTETRFGTRGAHDLGEQFVDRGRREPLADVRQREAGHAGVGKCLQVFRDRAVDDRQRVTRVGDSAATSLTEVRRHAISMVGGIHAGQHLMQEVVVAHAEPRQRVLGARPKMSGEAWLLEVGEGRCLISTRLSRTKKARQRSVSHRGRKALAARR